MTSGADRQVPRCSTCHTDMSVAHILVQCPNFENKRRANFLSNKSLEEILNENAPVEQIVKFLRDVDIYFDI